MSMKDNKDLNTVRGQIVTLSNQVVLRRLPTVQPIFGHLGNTSALIKMSYFVQLDMKI